MPETVIESVTLRRPLLEGNLGTRQILNSRVKDSYVGRKGDLTVRHGSPITRCRRPSVLPCNLELWVRPMETHTKEWKLAKLYILLHPYQQVSPHFNFYG